jgi:hypothetical protein
MKSRGKLRRHSQKDRIRLKSRSASKLSVNQRLGLNGSQFDKHNSLAVLGEPRGCADVTSSFLSCFHRRQIGLIAPIPTSRNFAHCTDVPQWFGKLK